MTLEKLLARADLWRGGELARGLAGSVAEGMPTGFSALDAELPGAGWPVASLVEILGPCRGGAGSGGAQCSGHGELSLLLPLLARQTRSGGWVLVVAPPLGLHAPALAAAGIDLARVVVVEAAARDRLWAIERGLRSGAVDSVLAWLPQLDSQALRRLQLAAEEGGGTLFAFRPDTCAGHASPAPLRIALAAPEAGVGGAGSAATRIRILKRRGPPLAQALSLAVARPRPLALLRHRHQPESRTDALARPLAARPAACGARQPSAA